MSLTRAERRAIGELGYVHEDLSAALGSVVAANTSLPAHASDFGNITIAIQAVQTTVLALVVTIQEGD